MRKGLKIYLAGAMSNLSFSEMNSWRINIKNELIRRAQWHGTDIRVINPVDYYNFKEIKHKSEREVMQYDLSHVKTSDIVIVNVDGLNTSIGTCIELYEALTRNIPVLAFGTKIKYQNGITYQKLHPWIKECITRMDCIQEELVDYITDFYFQ